MSSNKKTIDANGARVAAPNVAAIATSANAPGDMWTPGTCSASLPRRAPKDPLIRRIGASVPPEVPDASATHHATSFATASTASVSKVRRLVRTWLIWS